MARSDASRASSPAPDLEWLRPQKRDVGWDVLSLPLTRLQRHIYFLVDGHRTLPDLSRCTGKEYPGNRVGFERIADAGIGYHLTHASSL